MELYTDTYYIQRIQAGDTTCFACLLDKYSRPVHSLILKVVRNREDAEELAQDVFMKVFKTSLRSKENAVSPPGSTGSPTTQLSRRPGKRNTSFWRSKNRLLTTYRNKKWPRRLAGQTAPTKYRCSMQPSPNCHPTNGRSFCSFT